MALTRQQAALLRRRLREHDTDMLNAWRTARTDAPPDALPPAAKATLSVRVDHDTVAALDALADRDGVLMTSLARRYITEGIAAALADEDPLAMLEHAATLVGAARARLARPT